MFKTFQVIEKFTEKTKVICLKAGLNLKENAIFLSPFCALFKTGKF